MATYLETMAKHQRNLKKLRDGNATAEQIQQYMDQYDLTDSSFRGYQAVLDSMKTDVIEPGRLARIGRGLVDIQQGTQDLFGFMDDEEKQRAIQDLELYERGAGEGIDGYRMVGQALPMLLGGAPGAVARMGIAGRTGASALGGGVGGSLLFAKDDAELMSNIGQGALFGGGLNLAIPGAVKVASGITSGLLAGKDAVQDVGETVMRGVDYLRSRRAGDSPEIAAQRNVDRFIGEDFNSRLAALPDAAQESVRREAEAAMKNNTPFDPEIALLRAEAQRFGFEDGAAPTRGQLLKQEDPDIVSNEMKLAQRDAGASLRINKRNQRVAAKQYIDNLRTVGADEATKSLRSGVKAADEKLKEQVKEAYAKIDGGGALDPKALHGRTEQLLADYPEIPADVRNKIAKFVDNEEALTPESLMRLDQFIGSRMPPTPTTPRFDQAAGQLREAVRAVFDDVIEVTDESQRQLYQEAAAVAKNRYEALGPPGSIINRLLDDRKILDETQLDNLLFGASGQVNELKRLKDLLPENDFKTVQNYTEGRIKRNSYNRLEQFDHNKYSRVLDNMQESRLKAILGEEKSKELFDFGKTTQQLFAVPIDNTANPSGSGAVVADALPKILGLLGDVATGGGATVARNIMKEQAASAQEQLAARAVQESLGGQLLQRQRVPLSETLDPFVRAMSTRAHIPGLLGASYMED